MISWTYDIAVIVLFLGLLIFFHELGHFSIARLFGIGVRSFSLGFGKVLYAFTFGKTEYRLSAIPLGGYVSLAGEREEEELDDGFTPAESFIHRPAWQRMCVVAAGPLANFVLAFLLYLMLFSAAGLPSLAPAVGSLSEQGPAAQAGIEAGDIIKSINGTPVTLWSQVPEAVQHSNGEPLAIEVTRDGNHQVYTVTPQRIRLPHEPEDQTAPWRIGIGVADTMTFRPLAENESAFAEAWGQTLFASTYIADSIVKMFSGSVPVDQVGGPIMIGQMVREQAAKGLGELMMLAALISVNLGLLNLLPIPVLDGGHLVFFGIEAVFRRPVPKRIQEFTYRIGLTLLLTLMILATFNDLKRLLFS